MKRVAGVLVAVLTIVFAGVPVAVRPDPLAAIQSAREQIAAGDMSGAIAKLEQYVAVHPRELPARRFLGDLYFRTGQIARAQSVYEDILHADPGDRETHNRLGTVYAQENRVDDAIAQFSAALPGTDSVEDLVELHERKGDLDAYRRATQLLADKYPDDSALQAEMGQVYYAMHQPSIAEPYFRRALDVDPQNLTATNGLGLAEMEEKYYADAASMFTHCLFIDPNVYQCRLNLAANDLALGDQHAAKHDLDLAYAMAPERAETLVDYGYLADVQHDWRGAVAEYAKAIEMDPFLREPYIDLGLDYEQHRLYSLAQAVLLKGIASVRDDGRLHLLLGDAYRAEGNDSDALAQWLLATQGSDPEAASLSSQRVSLMKNAASPPPIH
jgi:tetratricopeptide (TPR) repeat protein